MSDENTDKPKKRRQGQEKLLNNDHWETTNVLPDTDQHCWNFTV